MLNGLRAVSVILVAVYHFGYPAPAGLSVTMFFVLSGFLITWLLLKEEANTGTISLRGFYLRRSLRIFPAYYAFIIGSIVADRVLNDPWTSNQILVASTYTLNYYNALVGHDTTPASHAWSLAVEEQFYLLWPLLFLLLMRRGRKVAGVALASAIVLAPLWRTLLFKGVGVGTDYIYNAFDTRFDSLAIGCLIAVIANDQTFLAFAQNIARRAWYPLITLCALAASRMLGTVDYAYTLGYTVDSILLGVLLLQMLQMHASRAWNWLESRSFNYLGTISYPMYLWHAWGVAVALHLGFLSKPLQLVAAIGATVAIAATSYHLWEKPILSLKPQLQRLVMQKRLRTHAHPAAAVAD